VSAALAAACLIHEVPLRGKPTIAQPSADPALQAKMAWPPRSHTPTHP